MATLTQCHFNRDAEYAKDRGMVGDLGLPHFLGPDGLMQLLSFIAEGRYKTAEVLEMIKRLHIPGYEHARHHFAAAISADVFEPNTMEGYYWQGDIEDTLEYAKEEGLIP